MGSAFVCCFCQGHRFVLPVDVTNLEMLGVGQNAMDTKDLTNYF
jgi:hypothetical protein